MSPLPTKKQSLLNQIRILTIGFASGILILATEYLLTSFPAFEYAATTLAVFGLFVISLLVGRAIRY